MISECDLKKIGRFLKPHGIGGEITLLISDDRCDLSALSCIVASIDGLFVPFFTKSLRRKTSETYLISFDGVDNENEASAMSNCEAYALLSEIPDLGDDADEGYYAEDLIGYAVVADGRVLGEIAAIDNSTENFLFVVSTRDGKQILLPVVDEFIVDINDETKTIEVDVPSGLIDLNK